MALPQRTQRDVPRRPELICPPDHESGLPPDLQCPAGCRQPAGWHDLSPWGRASPPGILCSVLPATRLHPQPCPPLLGGGGPCPDSLPTCQTLLFKLLKQGQAGDAGPGEDDVVLAGRGPAQAPGHHAVQLRLVLQRVQPVRAPAFLQVDVNLHQKHTRVSELTAGSGRGPTILEAQASVSGPGVWESHPSSGFRFHSPHRSQHLHGPQRPPVTPKAAHQPDASAPDSAI